MSQGLDRRRPLPHGDLAFERRGRKCRPRNTPDRPRSSRKKTKKSAMPRQAPRRSYPEVDTSGRQERPAVVGRADRATPAGTSGVRAPHPGAVSTGERRRRGAEERGPRQSPSVLDDRRVKTRRTPGGDFELATRCRRASLLRPRSLRGRSSFPTSYAARRAALPHRRARRSMSARDAIVMPCFAESAR